MDRGQRQENDGVEAVRAFLNAHQLSRFYAAWEAKESEEARAAAAFGNKSAPADPKIFNLAGYKKRPPGDPDAWDFYITADAWKEVTAGFNPRTLANVLKARGILVAPEKGHLTDKVHVPGIAEKIRTYHISHKIFEEDPDNG